ncbi:MAG: hypothetical protein Q4G24_08345 [Paracoccus sp. (in: a-proteobacteria)]|uniref:hypothetical protein n=1 Tax=Paracoccus sp. TaxID=267 RepID=UPI0026E0B8CC|nr:hypothetical protein [Paracoccus sp. (in: a-proteobacteria)]MDO5621463.1 hypothetical protein [Paracoccus sp. (in: a-proteobacteria)]
MSDPTLPPLLPGETIITRVRVTPAGMLRGGLIATGIFAVIILALQWLGPTGLSLGQYLFTLCGFAAVFAAVSWLFDRGRAWVLTDQRIIDRKGRALILSSDMSMRPFVNGFRLRDRKGGRMAIRSIPDPGGFAAQVRAQAIARTEAEVTALLAAAKERHNG